MFKVRRNDKRYRRHAIVIIYAYSVVYTDAMSNRSVEVVYYILLQ